jgi:hypothetical protein
MQDPRPTTTYVIVTKSGSDFDKSLAWLIEDSQKQGMDGLTFSRWLQMHPYPASVYLSEEVDDFFNLNSREE